MPHIFTDLDVVVTFAPGTGSTSLERACRDSGSATDLMDLHRIAPDDADPKHATWTQVRRLRGLDDVLEVVTTTRDPFDFLYADWFRTRTRWAAELDDPSSWVHRVDGMVDSIERAVVSTFSEWVADELAASGGSNSQRRVNRAHVDEASIVLRMEHMDEDLATALPVLSDRLGTVPSVNRTDRPRVLADVYDAATIALVTDAYSDDLRRFGYSPPG